MVRALTKSSRKRRSGTETGTESAIDSHTPRKTLRSIQSGSSASQKSTATTKRGKAKKKRKIHAQQVRAESVEVVGDDDIDNVSEDEIVNVSENVISSVSEDEISNNMSQDEINNAIDQQFAHSCSNDDDGEESGSNLISDYEQPISIDGEFDLEPVTNRLTRRHPSTPYADSTTQTAITSPNWASTERCTITRPQLVHHSGIWSSATTRVLALSSVIKEDECEYPAPNSFDEQFGITDSGSGATRIAHSAVGEMAELENSAIVWAQQDDDRV